MPIAAVDTALYRIQLPVPLSDSTHGTMTHFELVTVRVRDNDGAEGVGYTYTTGAGGAAVHALIDQGLRPVLLGADAELIEALWHRMWWKLQYGGRGGSVSLAVSACDIALWDLKARRLVTPLWRLLGGSDPVVPCYTSPR
jgi:L-alanine-DL-glutamate epimerase-like enolase superfamily enzyme